MNQLAPNTDLQAPSECSNTTHKVWKIVMDFLNKHDMTYTGGCKAFFTGLQAEKFHSHSLREAILVVHYDGGDLRYCFDRCNGTPRIVDELSSLLDDAGFRIEPINNWSCAIYRNWA